MSNPFDVPADIQDYNVEEAYRLGVSVGWDAGKAQAEHERLDAQP